MRTSLGLGTWPGRIRRPQVWKSRTSGGYAFVSLPVAPGRYTSRTIHRLVARAFLGEPPTTRHQVNHKNGIKTDNRVENLEWVTHQGNAIHAAEELGISHGSRNGAAKLSNAQVEEILALRGAKTAPPIAREYGIHVATVYRIWKGRTRKQEVKGREDARNASCKLNEDNVRVIKWLLLLGVKTQSIADMFDVSRGTISSIRTGKNWKHVT